MAALLIGYARCSTDQQDLTAQRDGLTALGVSPARIYVDHGLTRMNRERPGLREAMAACREGDTLVVTKLERLARVPTAPYPGQQGRSARPTPARYDVPCLLGEPRSLRGRCAKSRLKSALAAA